jgi:hypothetical protein
VPGITARGVQRARRLLLASTAGLLLSAGAAQAQAFRFGDVFLSGNQQLQEFTPTGQVVQALAGTSAGDAFCFSPSGDDLVVPGVGLYSNSGTTLSSSWSADPGSKCVIDGYGNVWVVVNSGGPVSEYTLTGTFERTLTLPSPLQGIPPFSIALGNNPCILYYGAFSDSWGIGRYNVCTNTSLTAFSSDAFDDDLAVLPNNQLIALDDPGASLLGTSGNYTGTDYPSPFEPTNDLRSLSLDPDGSSVWESGNGVVEYDIATGHLLTEWGEFNPSDPTQPIEGGPIAVYSPPLAGSADLGSTSTTLLPGIAQATRVTAAYTGSLAQLHVFLNSASSATPVDLGVYADNGGRPGALLAQSTVAGPAAGAWNFASVSGVTLTAGKTYWLAELAPAGGSAATVTASSGYSAVWHAIARLTTLPASWPLSLPWIARTPAAYGS